MKKTLWVVSILSLLIFVSCSSAFAADSMNAGYQVSDNGQLITFDQPPIMQNDRILVPMRAIFETLGATVNWSEKTQTITAVKGENTVIMIIGNQDITVSGKTITLDVPPQIVNDRTLVPVRAVAESFDTDVAWDENDGTVVISDKGAFTSIRTAIIESNLNNFTNLTATDENFDLDGDGMNDKITITKQNEEWGAGIESIQINDTIYSEDGPLCEYFDCAQIVDLNKNDNYKELIILDDGPSGDYSTTVYRYSDNTIKKMGTVRGGWNITEGVVYYGLFGDIQVNGMGKILEPQNCLNFIEPSIYTKYYVMYNDQLIPGIVDQSKSYQKTFTISSDFTGYFKTSDEVPSDDYYPDFIYTEDNQQREFHKGEKVTLLKIGKDKYLNNNIWYYVQLEDGTKGILAFFLGD